MKLATFQELKYQAIGDHRVDVYREFDDEMREVAKYSVVNELGKYDFSEKLPPMVMGLSNKYPVFFNTLFLGRNAKNVYVDQNFYSMKRPFNPLYSLLITDKEPFSEGDKKLVRYATDDIQKYFNDKTLEIAVQNVVAAFSTMPKAVAKAEKILMEYYKKGIITEDIEKLFKIEKLEKVSIDSITTKEEYLGPYNDMAIQKAQLKVIIPVSKPYDISEKPPPYSVMTFVECVAGIVGSIRSRVDFAKKRRAFEKRKKDRTKFPETPDVIITPPREWNLDIFA